MDNTFFINITDIFGSNNINNKTPIVIINSNDIHSLLKRIYIKRDNSIWDYNYDVLKKIFADRKMNFDDYLVSGHIYLNTKDFKPKELIFFHKQYSSYSNNYVGVCDFGNGSLWRAVTDDGKFSLGVVYSPSKSIPNKTIAVVPEEYIQYDKSEFKTPIDQSEFTLLACKDTGRTRLLINRYYRSLSIFKLINSNGNYITNIPDSEEVILKEKLNKLGQVVSYNAQGELIIDGKCLTTNDGENVLVTTCSNNDNQKWSLDNNGKVRSHSGKCLTSLNDEKKIRLEDCENDDSTQEWISESSSSTNSDYEWDYYKGKTVVLVGSDNPWYINKEFTVPRRYTENANFIVNDIDSDGHEYANYSTDFNIDARKPDLGYGYSYASRQGKECIEGFGNKEEENNNIVILVFLIILIVMLYKYYLRNKSQY